MTDAEVKKALKKLGVDRRSLRVVPLLPLVEVAWADGRVQPAERGLIREIAQRYGLQGAEAVVLERWLMRRPPEGDFQLARQVLLALWARDRERGNAPDNLDGIVRMCHCVARVAGGLFGVVLTVDRREAEVIADIEQTLNLGPSPLPEAPAPLSLGVPGMEPPVREPTPEPMAPKKKQKAPRPAMSQTPTILPADDETEAATLPLASLRKILMDDEETELDLPVLPHPYDAYALDDE